MSADYRFVHSNLEHFHVMSIFDPVCVVKIDMGAFVPGALVRTLHRLIFPDRSLQFVTIIGHAAVITPPNGVNRG